MGGSDGRPNGSQKVNQVLRLDLGLDNYPFSLSCWLSGMKEKSKYDREIEMG